MNGIKALHLSDSRDTCCHLQAGESMKRFRSYWRNPSLAYGLSKNQRQKLTDKFLELLAKDKEKNAEWMSKVMKERNKNLPHTCARGS